MTAIERFCDIIASEMSLANDQVYLWDQKINLPSDFRLYVAVGISSCKPFSSNNSKVATVSPVGLAELQSTNFLANLSVDILSRGTDARDRKEEVIMALTSTYSISQQETYGFLVGGISNSFTNLSALEGAAIPYRFNIGVNIQYTVNKQKQIAYYENFSDSLLIDP